MLRSSSRPLELAEKDKQEMTRKDYVLIARTLEQNRKDFNEGEDGLMLLNILAYQLSNSFEEDNPRFDRDRFLTACGVK